MQRAVALWLLLALLCPAGCAPQASAPQPPPPPVTPRPQTPKAGPVTAAPLAFDRINTTQGLVALTFDCCQNQKPAGFDSQLVQILTQHRTPATFFLGGAWVEAHPQAVQQLAAVPYFELDNHSYLHPHMTKASATRVGDELARTQRLVARYAGRTPRFFRPPYGEWNALVRAEAARQGLAVVTWSLATGDPDRHVSATDIVAAVRQAQPGSIIIMHANGRGWHTAEALPRVLSCLAERHLRPVTLAALVAAGKPHPLAPRQ